MGVNSTAFKIFCIVYVTSFVKCYPTINLRQLIGNYALYILFWDQVIIKSYTHSFILSDPHHGTNLRMKKNSALENPDVSFENLHKI